MNAPLIITLAVLLLMIVGFLCGKFKLGLVAMTATTVLCMTGVLTFNEAYANFANTNVVMIVGMFILSGALSKTSLVPILKKLVMKHSGKGALIAILYLAACVVLIQFTMPTALISMLLPVIADLALCYLGILNLNDVKNFINLDTIFMLAGVMPLGAAMQKTGAGDVVSKFIMSLLGGNPTPLVMLIAFYFAGALLTQFMSNTASQQVFVPLRL